LVLLFGLILVLLAVLLACQVSLLISRKVFLVVAGGKAAAQRHFEDTIQRKRTLDEVRRFLPAREIDNLEKIYHGSDFIVWGAVPGPMNANRREKMTPGRRGAHLQQWPNSFRWRDRRKREESGPRPIFLEGTLGRLSPYQLKFLTRRLVARNDSRLCVTE
jgi:hypothetical protein